MRLLLRFGHGLGDCAQFAIVLKHLKKYHPKWQINLEIPKGTSSFFTGLCNNMDVVDSSLLKSLRITKYCKLASEIQGYNGMQIENTEEYEKKYDQVIDVPFPLPTSGYASVPSTKITWCLQETFYLKPIKDLYYYQVNITDKDRSKVDYYATKTIKNNYAIIHYIPRSEDRAPKTFGIDIVEKICKKIISKKLVPVVLDWKNESPLPNQKTIFCPEKNHWLWDGSNFAEAGRLAALIERAKLYIGIDSGPTFIAGATKTPSITVWINHHPANYYDLSENVTHLLPKKSDDLIHSNEKEDVLKFFKSNYKHLYYTSLEASILKAIDQIYKRR